MRLGTLALGGLSLSDILAARAAAGQTASDNSVILFWMWGGPSQLETYDLKPDSPSEYRGPFRPIATKVPGIDICELFPQQARLTDKFSLVRSLHHEMSSHNDGSIEVLTGKTPAKADPTSTAEYPTERPMSPQHLLATIYRHLGIDPRAALIDFFGRPIHLLSEGEPIRELM